MGRPKHTREQAEASAVARFWPKVDQSAGPLFCFEWTGCKNVAGYGSFWNGTRQLPAHVYAWTLAYGPPPPDKPFICHRCDNPGCVNVRHLFPGSAADNTQDMWAKGRARVVPLPRGEAHHSAKLTVEKVIEARRRHAPGEKKAAIARSLGVSDVTVCYIVARKIWKHV